MAAKKNDLRKTPPWKEAEKLYIQLYSSGSCSIMGGCSGPGLQIEEVDKALEGISTLCPYYFNAWFQRGEIMLNSGRIQEGEKFYSQGFSHLLNIVTDEGEFIRILSSLQEKLEKLYHFKILVDLFYRAIGRFPDTASLYDDLGYYILKVPEIDDSRSLDLQARALKLDPDDDYLISNLGWINLILNRKGTAREYFQKALEYNIDNTEAAEHLDLVEYMIDHNLDYSGYLTRPADKEIIKRMLENVDFRGVREVVEEYNLDRLAAYKLHVLNQGILKPHQLAEYVKLMEIFLSALSDSAGDIELPLVENHQFIGKKMGNIFLYMIDSLDFYFKEIFLTIGEVLQSFYSFLYQEGKLMDSSGFNQVDKLVKGLVPVLVDNLEEYDRIRHDVTLSEEEKLNAAKRLFGF